MPSTKLPASYIGLLCPITTLMCVCVCTQIMIAGITVMKPVAVTRALVCSLNATADAVFLSTGPATETTTVEITAMRLMPIVPIRVSLDKYHFVKVNEV